MTVAGGKSIFELRERVVKRKMFFARETCNGCQRAKSLLYPYISQLLFGGWELSSAIELSKWRCLFKNIIRESELQPLHLPYYEEFSAMAYVSKPINLNEGFFFSLSFEREKKPDTLSTSVIWFQNMKLNAILIVSFQEALRINLAEGLRVSISTPYKSGSTVTKL